MHISKLTPTTLIICPREDRPAVEAILNDDGYEPVYLDYRNQPESVIAISYDYYYTDISDCSAVGYENYKRIRAKDFIASNK